MNEGSHWLKRLIQVLLGLAVVVFLLTVILNMLFSFVVNHCLALSIIMGIALGIIVLLHFRKAKRGGW